MNATSRKCIKWAVVLILLGAVLQVVGPQIFVAAAASLGPNASVGLGIVDVFVTIVRWTLIPMGSALVGAAIVIQALAPNTVVNEDEDRQ
jgi:hypothetical protein